MQRALSRESRARPHRASRRHPDRLDLVLGCWGATGGAGSALGMERRSGGCVRMNRSSGNQGGGWVRAQMGGEESQLGQGCGDMVGGKGWSLQTDAFGEWGEDSSWTSDLGPGRQQGCPRGGEPKRMSRCGKCYRAKWGTCWVRGPQNTRECCQLGFGAQRKVWDFRPELEKS